MFELIEALQYLSFTAGDKSQLEIPMEIAESINRENFTPESVQALDDAYKAAEDLMDDEGSTGSRHSGSGRSTV